MKTLYISAAHKSSGKTTISLGLAAALRDQGYRVQSFKKGPDYIDPLWLSQASGRPCFNLDFHTQTPAAIKQMAAARAAQADVALIEGNKGLFDGVAVDGSDSNAALAALLGAPVILVIDTRGITRGIAPLLTGYLNFDPDVVIAGVILNQVGGQRHESKLRRAVETYTDVPVVGAVRKNPALLIDERHLGLIPSNEMGGSHAIIQRWSEIVADQVDMSLLLAAAADVAFPLEPRPRPPRTADVRIGIARDAAFGFYYPDDLAAFERAGAELVAIDLTRDAVLPEVDGLFIGGGFPETSMHKLSGNTSMRRQIRQAVASGLPVYAECGGLMYLGRQISWRGETCPMVGAIPCDSAMYDQPQGRGYVRLRETGKAGWRSSQSGTFNAHEFHYSRVMNLAPGLEYAYQVERGFGIDGEKDGITVNNVLACYAHQRQAGDNHWVDNFTQFVRNHRSKHD